MRYNSINKSDPPAKWKIVVEDLIVVFLATLIPQLIKLGRLPYNLDEIYVPVLSSCLVALYSYMRIRGIEKPEEEPE